MLNGGGINPDGLSLDLQFAADKTLTARRGPTPVFTRGSTGTFVGSDGLIQTAAVNTPRFDHDPVTLACKGLLIEEGRTNLTSRSEEFNETAWLKLRSSISANSTASPSGDNSADKLIEDSSAGTHMVYRVLNTGSLAAHTFSVFAKADGRNFVYLDCGDGFPLNSNAYFDLSNGTLGTIGANATASITAFGNGWYRCSVTATPTSTATNGFYIQIASANGTRSYQGDGTSGIFIWGAQVEAGSFPTSYVPTTTGTLARGADVCSVTTAGWSNAGNDTMVAEYFVRNTPPNNTIILEGSPATSWMSVSFLEVNQQRNLYRHGGASNRVDARSGTNSVSLTSINKTALTSGEQIALNGSLSQTLFSDPPQADISTSLSIGSRGNGASLFLNGHIAAIRYYKKRLPNAKLQALTV
jgi:hypothetical protein